MNHNENPCFKPTDSNNLRDFAHKLQLVFQFSNLQEIRGPIYDLSSFEEPKQRGDMKQQQQQHKNASMFSLKFLLNKTKSIEIANWQRSLVIGGSKG